MEGGEEKSCDKSVETEAGRERKGGMGKNGKGRSILVPRPPAVFRPSFALASRIDKSG